MSTRTITTTDTNKQASLDLSYYRQGLIDDMVKDHARMIEANVFTMVRKKKYRSYVATSEPQD